MDHDPYKEIIAVFDVASNPCCPVRSVSALVMNTHRVPTERQCGWIFHCFKKGSLASPEETKIVLIEACLTLLESLFRSQSGHLIYDPRALPFPEKSKALKKKKSLDNTKYQKLFFARHCSCQRKEKTYINHTKEPHFLVVSAVHNSSDTHTFSNFSHFTNK